MFDQAKNLINDAHKIMVVQAENPDGDSLGSSLALEELLSNLGKEVVLYCPVDIPKYLHYISGWDRVVADFDTSVDLVIIVDTTADILLSKLLETYGARHFLETHPVLVLDHHTTEDNLSFDHTLVSVEAVATGEVIYRLASDAGWTVNKAAAEPMMIAIMSDSLGLTTPSVTPDTFRTVAALTEAGASNAEIEDRRREYMKKAPEILSYKADLIKRIEYLLDGALAIVHIPWEDIQEYSDQYNPSVLVLDEMRLVEGVQLAVAIKSYPDGKITGKLRGNLPIAEQVAGYFGGGGHAYAAGFRVYEDYSKIVTELVTATDKVLREYGAQIS